MITQIPEINRANIEPLEDILKECQEAIDNGEYPTPDYQCKKTYTIRGCWDLLKETPTKFLRYIGVN